MKNLFRRYLDGNHSIDKSNKDYLKKFANFCILQFMQVVRYYAVLYSILTNMNQK